MKPSLIAPKLFIAVVDAGHVAAGEAEIVVHLVTQGEANTQGVDGIALLPVAHRRLSADLPGRIQRGP